MSAAALSAVIVSDDEGGGCFGKRQSGAGLDSAADLDSVVKGSNTSSPRASFSEKQKPTLPTISLDELGPRESWIMQGKGGFGYAYLTSFKGHEVIVKMLSSDGLKEEARSAAASPTGTGLFAGEIETTTFLQGTKGVVKAYGAGVDEEGSSFLVLERIDFVVGKFLGKPCGVRKVCG